ncbi:protein-L-isoaspartate(D-aspartate) O-methyltransferase [uncultured Ramlibacter sp.]|uniref:protein-L-isoaspartate(D-aspartate) O-methyltransferase n=1 Tax=uncultured Ramlibacter sp. TaxID=260755 RepID=UPI00260D928B|nr:protein-L-isoaspartate(D-aspartate) O-methyltransferase [uncultured Ramlibacter sp.]
MTRRPAFPVRLDLRSGAPVAPKNIANRVQGTGAGGPSDQKISVQGGHGMDSAAVRARMVQKLAAQGVSDPRVLSAMGTVPRHRFVDSALVNQAYEDTSLPIGLGQTISKPNVVARMVELLLGGRVDDQGRLGRVLEIGTGCGYQAAVLACVATEVYSIERLRGLHDKARDNLRSLRLANLHLLFGDGMAGYAKGAPYAGIIAAAGGDAVPQAWIEQLAVGGRIIAPTVMPDGAQALVVLEKTAREMKQSVLEPVHFVPLKSGIA